VKIDRADARAMDPFAVDLMRRAPEAYALLSALEAGVRVSDTEVSVTLAQVEALDDPALTRRLIREVERLTQRAERLSESEREAYRQAFLAELDAVDAENFVPQLVGIGSRDRERGGRRSRGAETLRGGDSGDPHRRPCSDVARHRRASRRGGVS
jgi:hypothetical protein